MGWVGRGGGVLSCGKKIHNVNIFKWIRPGGGGGDQTMWMRFFVDFREFLMLFFGFFITYLVLFSLYICIYSLGIIYPMFSL